MSKRRPCRHSHAEFRVLLDKAVSCSEVGFIQNPNKTYTVYVMKNLRAVEVDLHHYLPVRTAMVHDPKTGYVIPTTIQFEDL